MEGEEMGYIPSPQGITDDVLKYISEGGFSSKQKIECFAEIGPEARTHRPSLSPSSHPKVNKTLYLQRGGKS